MVAAEFQEIYMCKLTTATTCYSSPNAVIKQNGQWTGNLATEKHVLQMQLGCVQKSHNRRHENNDNNDSTNKKEEEEEEEEEGIQSRIPKMDDENTAIIINDETVSFTEYPIPTSILGIPRRIGKKLICAGYSQCQPKKQHQGLWEALVLLDTSQQQEQGSTNNNNSRDNDDDKTTATADSTSNKKRFRRRNTGGNASVASDGGASIVSTSSAPAVISIKTSAAGSAGVGDTTTSTVNIRSSAMKTLANLEEEEEEEEGDDDLEEEPYIEPVARLVLQNRERKRLYFTGLEFRPLSPCIQVVETITSSDGGNDNEISDQVVVWVGSADDTKLRLFRADDTSDTLVEVPLEEKWQGDHQASTTPISFQSPVMAIDSLTMPRLDDDPPTLADDANNLNATSGGEDDASNAGEDGAFNAKEKQLNEHNNILAVACQDGTLRLIGYSLTPKSILCCREEYTATVDGPIVRFVLHEKKDTQQIEAVFGSLCGYVARFVRSIHAASSDTSDLLWNGPYMVAEGFWMNHYVGPQAPSIQEDSVIAVHAWDDKIALGTYSGRCLLYGKSSDDDSEDYGQPFWDCQLTESIHGICHVPTAKSSLQLLVTTRRSIHIFEEVAKCYYPDMAKRKLEFLLSRHRPKSAAVTPASTPERTPALVVEAELEEKRGETEKDNDQVDPANNDPEIQIVGSSSEKPPIQE